MFLLVPQKNIVAQSTFQLRGQIIDHVSKKLIFSRVYLEDSNGNRFHVQSDDPAGNAIPYRVENKTSNEVHTTLSNHPFKVDLKPGRYRLTAEHGKEYLSNSIDFVIEDKDVNATVALKRWSNISKQNWYSGEVHLHRKVEEMPTVMQAEDLNVTLPLTYWVTDTDQVPKLDNKVKGKQYPPELIPVSDKQVIWPVNTEYEIFSVRRQKHTLGAFFVLGHRQPFQLKTPPVRPILAEAKAQGALIDLDKHNWPWSMMLIPQMEVDLFELTNNHTWRTRFLFKDWYKEYVADFMQLDLDKDGNFDATSWLKFGFANYYALLNCGFRISPSGGTASGVHPVPAGFGRVYVHLPEGFSFRNWMKGLKEGRSFVTNGPLLDAKLDDQHPGARFEITEGSRKVRLTIIGRFPSNGGARLEVIHNSKVITPKTVRIGKDLNDVTVLSAEMELEVAESGWICVRCLQDLENGNLAFAHSAPFYFKKGDNPVIPKRAEVNYLLKRVEDEIERNSAILKKNEMAEYEAAREFYKQKLKIAQ